MDLVNDINSVKKGNFTFLKLRKIVGALLIFIGVMFASPPFDMLPNDFLNIFLALYLVSIGWFDKLSALFFTYTLFPFVLISIGVFIYPITGSRISWIIKKFRKVLKWYVKFIKKPRNLIVSIVLFAILYYFYSQILIPMI